MTAERERVWVRLPERSDASRDAVLTAARGLGFSRFVGDRDLARPGERWATWQERRVVVDRGPSLEERQVRTPGDLAQVLDRLALGKGVLLRWSADRVIPHERLVAMGVRRGPLWVVARSSGELPAALGALERGADAVVVEVHSLGDLAKFDDLIAPELPELRWGIATVESVEPGGFGDRIVVDTTSALRGEEGLLVGGQAAFLFHLASEAEGSAFSRPRSFRVNAGALHSYVLLANGETRYLSELEAGDRLLAVAPRRAPRIVRVGRLKVERRPLTLVRARTERRAVTLFVQEAETVRLSERRRRVAVTSLQVGMVLHGVRLPPARHLGLAVEEFVEER